MVWSMHMLSHLIVIRLVIPLIVESKQAPNIKEAGIFLQKWLWAKSEWIHKTCENGPPPYFTSKAKAENIASTLFKLRCLQETSTIRFTFQRATVWHTTAFNILQHDTCVVGKHIAYCACPEKVSTWYSASTDWTCKLLMIKWTETLGHNMRTSLWYEIEHWTVSQIICDHLAPVPICLDVQEDIMSESVWAWLHCSNANRVKFPPWHRWYVDKYKLPSTCISRLHMKV